MKPWTGFIACFFTTSAYPAVAQTLGQGGRDDIPWLQLSSGLALCLFLAVAAALMLRQRLGPRSSGQGSSIDWNGLRGLWRIERPRTGQRLAHLETRRLPGSVTATVMRYDDREYLITSSLQGHLVVLPLENTASPAAKE